MNHYPRHIGDYLRDTGHLSLLEHGVYSRLLDLYYLNNGPLQLTVDDLIRKLGARAQDEREAVERVLREFFAHCNGVWSHKRADQEIERFKVKSDTARESAYRSHSVRYANARQKLADAKPTPSQRKLDSGGRTANQEPITRNQEPRTIDIPPTPPAGGKGFDWFSDLPEDLDTPEFRAAFLEWIKYRKKIKAPYPAAGVPAMWRRAQEAGVQAAIDGFETCMANGWQGTFPKRKTTKANDHRQQKRDREFSSHIEVPDL